MISQPKLVTGYGRERWVELDGSRLRYLYRRSVATPPTCRCRTGSDKRGAPPARAVLLIHGLIAYSFSWRYNLAALAEQSNVYAIDLPGMGESERPPQMDSSARGMARHLLRFMDAVGISNADVVGTSHGGMLATMLAAEAPERIRRLVLVAPANPWSAHGQWMTRMLASKPGALAYRCLWPYARFVRGRMLARMYGDPRRITPGIAETYAAPLRRSGTCEHLLAIMRSWQSDLRQLEAALPRIAHLPTLLIWGSRDRIVLPSSGEILQQKFANAELVILEGAGHLPYEEVPEEFNRVVCGFLAR